MRGKTDRFILDEDILMRRIIKLKDELEFDVITRKEYEQINQELIRNRMQLANLYNCRYGFMAPPPPPLLKKVADRPKPAGRMIIEELN